MRIALRSLWHISGGVHECYHADAGDNFHGNDAETSLMLHQRPDLVDMARAVDEPNRSAGCFFSYRVDQESEHGGVGRPSTARPDTGAWLLDRCAESLAAQLRAALSERTPLEDPAPEAR